MNIGPMGTGKFSAPDLDILKQIAAWWKVNGEASIRGTEGYSVSGTVLGRIYL